MANTRTQKNQKKRNSPTTVASLAVPTDGKRSQLVPSVGNGKGLAEFLVTVGWCSTTATRNPNRIVSAVTKGYWFWLVAFFFSPVFANVYKCTRVQCSSVGIYSTVPQYRTVTIVQSDGSRVVTGSQKNSFLPTARLKNDVQHGILSTYYYATSSEVLLVRRY